MSIISDWSFPLSFLLKKNVIESPKIIGLYDYAGGKKTTTSRFEHQQVLHNRHKKYERYCM